MESQTFLGGWRMIALPKPIKGASRTIFIRSSETRVLLSHYAFTFCSRALASPLAVSKTMSNTYINHFNGYEQVN